MHYKWNDISVLLVACFLSLMLVAGAGLAATNVDFEIVILADASRSVDAKEYARQRDGYASMFSSPDFYNNYLVQNRINTIAVTFVYWSSPKFIKPVVSWTVIDSVDSSQAFGTAIRKASPVEGSFLKDSRPFDGTTAPGSAIAFGVQSLSDNHFEGDRKIIVISGDGIENDGIATNIARDEALAKGVTAISAIAIGSEALKKWFSSHVQGGKNSFTLRVKDYQELPEAIQGIFQRILSPI